MITVVTPSTLDVAAEDVDPDIDPNPLSELVPVVVPDAELELEAKSEEVVSDPVPVIDCRKSESELDVDRLVGEELGNVELRVS